MFDSRLTELEVDLDAIATNVRTLRTLIGQETELMAVVKANAYGHGAVKVSRIVLENGATRLGVANWEEGVELREAEIKSPIVVLGTSSQEDLEPIIPYKLIPAVGDFDTALKLSRLAIKYGESIKVHVNIDTGMRRLGIEASRSVPVIEKIIKLPGILVEGIFTHFTSSEDTDKNFALRQFEKYIQIIEQLKKDGFHIPLRHVADSGAILNLPSTHLDMVRPGIAIYGIYPSENVKNKASLRPASKLKTRIISLRELPPGDHVGYGGTYTTTRSTTVATIPIGYADGYNRGMSNRGEVLIRGKRAPIIGRVCMDHCMVNVTHLPEVRMGDEVVLWGKQGDECISVVEVASKIGTIAYEVLTMVDKRRVLRRYIR